MKYRLNSYRKAVEEYREGLSFLSNKTILIEFSPQNRKAFYSLAPLSNALHELKADLNVMLSEEKNQNLKIMERFWNAFEGMKKGKKNKKTRALKRFIKEVEKRTEKIKISRALQKPDAWITARENCFVIETKKGILFAPLLVKWLKKRKGKKLRETCNKILEQGFGLKKNENFSIGFELVPEKEKLELPLVDYLDNFQIAESMALTVKERGAKYKMGACTRRDSKIKPMNKIAELSTMVSGCEHEKKIKEPIFKKYAVLSKELNAGKWVYADTVFSISGKGYTGKHLFGTQVGYPSPDKKTRWSSPGSMFLKPWWKPQSRLDSREPIIRCGITETLPIENFIRTCNIDYKKMRNRNQAIKKAVEKSEKIIVKGKKLKAGKTEFEIGLGEGSKKRIVLKSDSDARTKVNQQILKEKNVLAGMFANYPGGEAFFTPENIKGSAIGDVVINIDQSYVLSEKNPIAVKFREGEWKLKKAPEKIKKRIQKELRDAKKLIKEYEESKALPQKIINQYKKNFKRVGEFAVNTNPKAKLSNYLIENEKIAKMIHLALGSGFEPDRQTLYHWDFVINSPKQKLDIYGLDSKQKKHWIIKKGEFTL